VPYHTHDLLLAATGDSLVTRRISVHDEKEYLALIELLRREDVTFTNLETLIHSYEGYAAAE
jgi:poly-gamma-glutamate synthesis protein (capsule biosynthesis protein)